MAVLLNLTHRDSPDGASRVHEAQALVRNGLRSYAVATRQYQGDDVGTSLLQAAADRDEATIAGYEGNADWFGNGSGVSGEGELPLFGLR